MNTTQHQSATGTLTLSSMSHILCSAMAFSAEALTPLYDPKLCYILDGFLLLYGLVITGLLLREKFFKSRGKILEDDDIYTDLKPTDGSGYGRINRKDPESATARDNRRNNDDTYTSLKKPTDDTYREIAVKDKQRRRNKNDQVYQGLSAATKDTYDSLQMQPLPPR
ncbi:T-cell surface glycoprotein CD3 zeta chain-like isoform X1 [Oncorhynchus mykiss]|uniref:T-cell surface glycoprotein CD3 zeta chain-like isoform X1 n=1 Tax=Oncorhynchus mykiss TaxID=8022 RepID=UPI001878BF0F|nr:T-cell surface glycoprotein CD3 zeta chain-like isoform X1 [Oncorhynchus mykiss]